MTTPSLHAGVARADITPPVGITPVIWGAQLHTRAEGVDMPLYATVLALRDAAADITAIVVDLDLLLLPFSLAADLRRAVSDLTGVPVTHVRVSATHGHSGPSLAPTWVAEGGEFIAPYVASLPGLVAGAAWAALRAARPARLAHGAGRCALAVNRRQRALDGRVVVGRDPNGFVDHTVRVLRFDDLDERPLAALVHYACHPILMAWENRLITPDYPGAVRHTVEQVTGAPCLFLQGCAGDVAPVDVFTVGHTGDARFYRRAGAMLGAEASRVFLELERAHRRPVFSRVLESGAPLGTFAPGPIEEPDGAVRVVSSHVTLPVRPLPPPDEAAAIAADARAELDRLRAQHGSDHAEPVHLANVRAKHTAMRAGHAQLTGGRSELDVELHGIRVGGAAFVAAPVEVFGQLGAAVAEASPFAWTAVSGYTNGAAGYLPTDAAFDEGGYEIETASPFARGAGPAFVRAAAGLLQQLAL
ncbi:MAG TPA: neutral/alkaline non-lysosomal ceramidase N-terminal domain-containing protein [Chloroflexota bacterium]|nr:neutral/alkaline non-lysosomal ceramidase N-terminal domain-containing protein [Chloroflexota bacterium]